MQSFFSREGRTVFEDPDRGGRKYLPQINEWSKGTMSWKCERAGGSEHVPVWEAYPVCTYLRLTVDPRLRSSIASMFIFMHVGCEEELPHFIAQGYTKQAAKEASAKLMALSGHCVSSLRRSLCYGATLLIFLWS